jgi:radical SAM protein with 4Fe4S-binding SPASM domain
MDQQLSKLLKIVKAREINKNGNRVSFKTGGKQQVIAKDFPAVLQIETSSFCNLVCLGCPQKDITRPRGFMEPELFRKIVDEIANYKVRVWLHYMGEPLMHPKIFELIEYATGKLEYFGMSSNAMLLTEDKIEKILDSGLIRFEISVDSLNPELLEILRPGGSGDKIIENAHEFFKMKYARNQKYPITSINYRELKSNLKETGKFAEHWRNILQEPDFVLAFPYEKFGGHESDEHATYTVSGERTPCLKLWNKALILSDGRLVTCDAMFNGQRIMGDTHNESIKQIWESPQYYDLRQKHIEGLADGLEICSQCDSWYRETGPIAFTNLTAKTDKPNTYKTEV